MATETLFRNGICRSDESIVETTKWYTEPTSVGIARKTDRIYMNRLNLTQRTNIDLDEISKVDEFSMPWDRDLARSDVWNSKPARNQRADRNNASRSQSMPRYHGF